MALTLTGCIGNSADDSPEEQPSITSASVWQHQAIEDFDDARYTADDEALYQLEELLVEHGINGNYSGTDIECNDGGLSTFIEYALENGDQHQISVCDPDPIARDFHDWAQWVRN